MSLPWSWAVQGLYPGPELWHPELTLSLAHPLGCLMRISTATAFPKEPALYPGPSSEHHTTVALLFKHLRIILESCVSLTSYLAIQQLLLTPPAKQCKAKSLNKHLPLDHQLDAVPSLPTGTGTDSNSDPFTVQL